MPLIFINFKLLWHALFCCPLNTQCHVHLNMIPTIIEYFMYVSYEAILHQKITYCSLTHNRITEQAVIHLAEILKMDIDVVVMM